MVQNYLRISTCDDARILVGTCLPAHHLQVDTLSATDESKLFMRAAGVDDISPADSANALVISETFGDFPLALSQIEGFISQRMLTLQHFLPLYEWNRAKIDARKVSGSEYEYTVSTARNISFERLTENSTTLLNLLAFLIPTI
ncbi:hypothetical protein NHQ30_008478 [Ciborinia camelliae]|nr:hypothetical protein NHQ30_008478 [Ciborinia camelliae]